MRFLCELLLILVGFGIAPAVAVDASGGAAIGRLDGGVSPGAEHPRIAFEWALGDLSAADLDRLLGGAPWIAARRGESSLSLGYQSDPVWVRIRLSSTHPRSLERVLALSNPLIDHVEATYLVPGRGKSSHRLGKSERGSSRSDPTVLPRLLLDLPPGETVVLMRLQSKTALATRFDLLSAPAWSRATTVHALKAGVVIAFQAAAAFAALVIGVFLGSRLWLAFAACTAGSAATFAHVMGYLSWWLGPAHSAVGDAIGGWCFALAVVAGAFFCSRALRLHRDRSRLARAGLLALTAGFACASAALFAGWTTVAIESMLWLATAVALVFLGLLISRSLRGLPLGWFLGAGLMLYLGTSVLRFLRSLGVLPSAWWTEELHELTSIVYLVMILTGIGLQTRSIVAERDRLTGQLLAERQSRNAERDFLAMLSHELRTPLATIEAASSVLRDVITLDRGARTSRLDKIQRAVARIRALFDRHLGGPGMRDDWHLPRPERLSLSGLLTQVLEDWRRDWRDRRFRLLLPRDPVEVFADRGLIVIAVGNLIDNALSYGPSDGEIVLSLSPSATGWRISVQDQGQPLPPADSEVIFDRYVRGTASVGKPGAGLGLFVVRRVAESHLGRVGFERGETGGNRFWMEIASVL